MKDLNSHEHENLTENLSRRSLLRNAGMGAVALAMLAAEEGAALPQQGPPRLSPPGIRAQASTTQLDMQLPFWGDGSGWNQSEYFQTIQAGRKVFPKIYQSADVDGDGYPELIGRGPNGLLINHFDPTNGQWEQQSDLPGFSDAYGWNLPQYFLTIQTADVDGDGHAEVLALAGDGIYAFKYDPTTNNWAGMERLGLGPDNLPPQQQYYLTMQTADINGDGKAELLVRLPGGLLAFRYDTTTNGWIQMDTPEVLINGSLYPLMTDYDGWQASQYYLTIQAIPLLKPGDTGYTGDGTHMQAVVLGRAGDGLHAYKYDKPGQPWKELTGIPLSDKEGWQNYFYYTTIQGMDIDGDGRAEVLARADDGLHAFKHDATTATWKELAVITDLSDLAGWANPQNFLTIQGADVDGDGEMEVLARHGGRGLLVFKYNAAGNSWSQLAALSDMTDANGWNQVDQYLTIQGTPLLKPGETGYTGDGTHTQAVVLGRGPLSILTWRYDAVATQWTRSTVGFPPWTTAQQAAYRKIDSSLFINAEGNIRGLYNDLRDDWEFLASRMYNPLPLNYDKPVDTILALPAGVLKADWNAVTWQITWEMLWVNNVQDWFHNKVGGLITNSAIGKGLALDDVATKLTIPPDSTLNIVFDILAMLAGVAAAILAGPVAAVAAGAVAAGAVAGCLGAIFSAAGGLIPGGTDPITVEYNVLKQKLTDSFTNAVNTIGKVQFAITGGNDSDSYFPADYGLLKQIGQNIYDGIWFWPEESNLELTAERVYAVYVWQMLLAAQPWYIYKGNSNPANPNLPPYDYPNECLYQDGPTIDHVYWLSLGSELSSRIPPNLKDLFDPSKDGSIFPLQVPVADVFLALNGWPTLPTGDGNERPPLAAALPPGFAVKPDLHLRAKLSRNPLTHEILATVTIHNRGLKAATNCEMTAARLGLRQSLDRLPTHPLRVSKGHPQTVTVSFPALSAGQTVVLSLSGRYTGGTFGGSFRVTLP